MKKRTENLNYYTLIELLVVIAVIVLLSGIAYTVAGTVRTKGKETKTEALLASIHAGLEAYKDKFGFYPVTVSGGKIEYREFVLDVYDPNDDDEDSENNVKNNLNGCFDLSAIIANSETETVSGNKVRQRVRDAFNQPVYYRCPGKYNRNTYDLGSVGGDGKFGSDISYRSSDLTQEKIQEFFGTGDDLVNFKRFKR